MSRGTGLVEPALGLRDGYNAFIEGHEVGWELLFGFVAIVFVALGILIDQAPEGTRPGLEVFELGLTGLFTEGGWPAGLRARPDSQEPDSR